MSNQPASTADMVAPPGLKGLVVADTTIGSVRGDEGFYHYRHHDAVDVARRHGFEAAAALVVDGRPPDDGEASEFRGELAAARHLTPAVVDLVGQLADRIDDPLAALTAAMPLVADHTPTIDLDHHERRRRAIAIAGAVPTILAAIHRRGLGQAPLEADPGLGHAADYLRMVTGAVPAPELVEAVEAYLVLTIDHGFNASTFTTRVITSTGAGVPGVLAGAVGALSGPLHGGAPSRVLDMLTDIGDPSAAEAWARSRLATGAPIMGFGHAVYRADDPRSALLRQIAKNLGGELVERAMAIEARLLGVLADWKPEARIVTNVEYYAAVVLHLAGLPQSMFTPTFTTSRVVGWVAHLLEQAANNKIMRPKARYVGPEPTRGERSMPAGV